MCLPSIGMHEEVQVGHGAIDSPAVRGVALQGPAEVINSLRGTISKRRILPTLFKFCFRDLLLVSLSKPSPFPGS
eukprot:1216577-Amphidinium_carterae.1